jgi:hypothetical protein
LVTLTPLASADLSGSGMEIAVIGAAGTVIGTCSTGTDCPGTVTKLSAGLVTYQAVIRPVGGGTAVASDSVEVTYIADWTVSLDASATSITTGTSVTLTATTNHDVGPTVWYITILDETGATVDSCGGGTQCAANVTSNTAVSHTYHAVIDRDGTIAATSNDVPVSWPEAVVVPPSASITVLRTYAAAPSFAVAWDGSPGTRPISGFDVAVRRASWNGSFGAASTWLSDTTGTTANYPGARGSTYCFRVRARDDLGNLSGWTGETCTAVALDDRSLTRGSGWTRGAGAAYYDGTYLRTWARGATLTRTGVVAKRIAIMVTTCRTCGSMRVYWRGVLVKTVSLVSPTTVNRTLITVASFSAAQSGTLRLVVATSGKQVIVDGLAIRRS